MNFKNSIQSLVLKGSPLLVLLCWTTLFLPDCRAQEKSLAWKFERGNQFIVETTKLSKSTSTLDSRITSIRSEVTIEFSWTVDSVNDSGTATITQELKKFSIDIGDPAVPLQAITYSSDDAPEDLSSAIRKLQRKSKPLIGLKCTLKMTSNGKVTSVQLAPDSQKRLEKLANAPNLRALFSKESLEKLNNDFSFNAIPADASPTGWSKTEVQQGGFGEVSLAHKFSVSPAELIKGRKLTKVNVVSTLTLSEPDVASKKTKAKNEISQSLVSYAGNGTITFDQDGGYFSGSQFVTEIKSERQYREKVIATSLENETRIKIEKK